MGPIIPGGSRVLLDTVALIYFLEENSRYSKFAESTLDRIQSAELQGIMASLVFAELLVPLYRAGDSPAATRLANRLLTFRNLEITPLSNDISMEAARLRAVHGLRTPDAIHGATAIAGRATGILTNDRKMKVLSREGLSVWLFDELC